MIHLITKLQRKPEHIRSNISFFIAAGLTALIFFMWIVTLDSRLSLNDESAKAQRAGNAPFPLLIEQGRVLLGGILGE